MFRPIAVLLLSCLTGASYAQMHQGHHGASGMKEDSARAELGALAVFDGRGTLWAAHKDSGHVAVSRSGDLGQTWSRPVRVTPAREVTDTGADARPKVAIGPGGEVYVTWTRPLGQPYTGEIRFSRSIDGGKTFSTPVIVHADRQRITHRFDSIGVNRGGQVFITWIDKRDGVSAAKAKQLYRGAAVYFAVSDDRGASFRGDYKLADHSCECCRIALLPREDGSILAMWRHVFAPNIRDHGIAQMFPDGRAGAVRRATFDDWRIDACPHHGPSLAADDTGGLHAVWFTQGPKNAGVFYGRLRDGGMDALRRVGGDTAEHADLAIIGQRVGVAWKEFDGERSQLRAMVSADGGGSWQQYQLASTTGASDQPRVLTMRDRFYVFWNTRNEPLSVRPLP